MPKPEEVPKKPKKNKVSEVLGLEVSRILFFLVPLRFWQGFQEKYCQNLRRYQKNKILETSKPKTSETSFFWGGVFWYLLRFLARFSPLDFGFFWYLFRFWQSFQGKYCQKPEEVPKKPKFWRSPGPKTSGTLVFLVFLVPPQVLAKRVLFFLVPPQVFCTILLPKPGERKIHPKIRNPGMKDFSRKIHLKMKSRNEEFPFNF